MTVNRKDFDTQADYDEYVAATDGKVPAWRKPLRQLYGPDYALHADVDTRHNVKRGICSDAPPPILNEMHFTNDSEFAVGEDIPPPVTASEQIEAQENEAKFGPDFKGKVAAEMKRFHEDAIEANLRKADVRRYGAVVTEATRRKGVPVYSGFDCYFPDAIEKVAELSRIGNEQHNPGSDLHWDRSKSGDELDCLKRHLLDHAKGIRFDLDGVWHLTKVAWRAMASLQKLCEELDAPKHKAPPKLDQAWIDKVSREEDVPDAHFDGSDKDDLGGGDPTYPGPQARWVAPE